MVVIDHEADGQYLTRLAGSAYTPATTPVAVAVGIPSLQDMGSMQHVVGMSVKLAPNAAKAPGCDRNRAA